MVSTWGVSQLYKVSREDKQRWGDWWRVQPQQQQQQGVDIPRQSRLPILCNKLQENRDVDAKQQPLKAIPRISLRGGPYQSKDIEWWQRTLINNKATPL